MTNEYLKESTIELIKKGNLEALKKLPKKELLAKDKSTYSNITRRITHYGKLEILKWLYELSKTDTDFRQLLVGEDSFIVYFAAAFGHLDILQWVYELSIDDKDFKELFLAEYCRERTVFDILIENRDIKLCKWLVKIIIEDSDFRQLLNDGE